MIMAPLRAFSGCPLTSMLTRSSLMVPSRRRGRLSFDDRAPFVLDHVLKLVPVVLQEALHGPRRRIPERADRVTLDPVCDIEQKSQVLAPSLTRNDALEHAVEPTRAFAARRALTAGLRIIKARQSLERAHHAGGLVHDDDGAGAHR